MNRRLRDDEDDVYGMKRAREMGIEANGFRIVREPVFNDLYEYLMKYDYVVIAGGYSSSMFYEVEIYENSDVDTFCIGVDVKTFVMSFEPYFNIRYEVVHEKLVDVYLSGFHRKISFIGIEKNGDNPVKQILDDFDSSYCKAAIHKNISYISYEMVIAKNTGTVFFHIYPRKKRVEKMLNKGFRFAGYQYKEISEEFPISAGGKDFILFNNINTMTSTDFTLAKFSNKEDIADIFVYSAENRESGNYFVSDGIPFYSKNYDFNRPLLNTKQRNNIICPYYEHDTLYGNVPNRVYVSFVLDTIGYFDDYFIESFNEIEPHYKNYINNLKNAFNHNILQIGKPELLLIFKRNTDTYDALKIYRKYLVKIKIQIFIYSQTRFFYAINKLISVEKI